MGRELDRPVGPHCGDRGRRRLLRSEAHDEQAAAGSERRDEARLPSGVGEQESRVGLAEDLPAVELDPDAVAHHRQAAVCEKRRLAEARDAAAADVRHGVARSVLEIEHVHEDPYGARRADCHPIAPGMPGGWSEERQGVLDNVSAGQHRRALGRRIREGRDRRQPARLVGRGACDRSGAVGAGPEVARAGGRVDDEPRAEIEDARLAVPAGPPHEAALLSQVRGQGDDLRELSGQGAPGVRRLSLGLRLQALRPRAPRSRPTSRS